MKTSLTTTPESAGLKFPLLAVARDSTPKDYTVLFTSEQEGTVVHYSNEAPWKVGYHAKDWIPVTNNQYWRILPEGATVTIVQ